MTAKLCCRFLVLTAARSGEARGATWDEIDVEDRVWRIPSERMKAGGAGSTPTLRGCARRFPGTQGVYCPLVGDPQGDRDPLGPHLLPRHAQEVGLGDLVVEDDQDGGPCSVVVDGPVRRVVAQIGREAVRHGGGPHGAALPLQEEGPLGPALAQDAEGVGVDGAHPVVVPEVAGGPPERIELDDLPPQQGGLRGERGQEAVDGGGVLDVPEQLAVPSAGDVAPLEGAIPVFEGDAPPPFRHADRGAVPAGEEGEAPIGEGQSPATVPDARREAEPLNPSSGMTAWEALWGETPMSAASSPRPIQGQLEIRSRARFSAGLTKRGSMWSEMSSALDTRQCCFQETSPSEAAT